MNRRLFLKGTGLTMFGAGVAPVWLARAAADTTQTKSRKKVLVAIFQRGAVDGLNMVIPVGDPHYYKLRPSIAIPKASALELDGFFGLHPAMAPLKPLWDSRQLAIVHASGSPDPTRSHFDAQDYMESGTPGRKSTADGWLNRALPATKSAPSPVRAVSIGTNLPRTLRGANPAVAIGNLNEFRIRQEQPAATFEDMYASTVDKVLKGSGRDTFDAVHLLESIQKTPYQPASGVRYPGGRLSQSLQQIARLIKADAGLEVAFADMGGWDTHVNEVGFDPSQGQLANLLGQFAGALGAFTRDLGDRMEDVLIVTMSEFGRTARENGNRGTDHGHANAMLVMGGSVNGGKIHGEWPGLAPEQLWEGRDLAVTTDFRDVLGAVVQTHLGLTQLSKVFPNHQNRPLSVLISAS
jgi:uncharacterized protein (DUF1501 family)